MKTNTTISSADISALVDTFVLLDNSVEAYSFMRDLLTESEIAECANRWKVARMLSDSVPYTTIEAETDMSSTTIARISKWLNKGMGGYAMMLQKTKTDSNNTQSTPNSNQHPVADTHQKSDE